MPKDGAPSMLPPSKSDYHEEYESSTTIVVEDWGIGEGDAALRNAMGDALSSTVRTTLATTSDTKKLFPKLGSTPIGAENRGFQLLKGMGWREGEALGKKKQGITEPIASEVKLNRAGLGALAEKQVKVERNKASKQEKAERKKASKQELLWTTDDWIALANWLQRVDPDKRAELEQLACQLAFDMPKLAEKRPHRLLYSTIQKVRGLNFDGMQALINRSGEKKKQVIPELISSEVKIYPFAYSAGQEKASTQPWTAEDRLMIVGWLQRVDPNGSKNLEDLTKQLMLEMPNLGRSHSALYFIIRKVRGLTPQGVRDWIGRLQKKEAVDHSYIFTDSQMSLLTQWLSLLGDTKRHTDAWNLARMAKRELFVGIGKQNVAQIMGAINAIRGDQA